MIEQTTQYKQQSHNSIAPLNYLYNWMDISCISSTLTNKVPFKKIKIFHKEKFNSTHQSSLYRIYLQKIYLIIYAIMTNQGLSFSSKFYQKNGLIFGLYSLQKSIKIQDGLHQSNNSQQSQKKFKGIQMVKLISENQQMTRDKFCEVIKQNTVQELQYEIMKLNLSQKQQYEHWDDGIKDILDQQTLSLPNFLQKFEKLPLTEHYIHKVRLENALLSSIFSLDPDLNIITSEQKQQSYKLQHKIQEEKKILDNIFYGHGELDEQFGNLETIFTLIYDILYIRGKIGTAEGPQFRKIKNVYKGKIIQRSFAIILSQYRVQTITNQKKIQNSTSSKDGKPITKIEIKSKNGSLEPISGNVIFVKFVWEVIPKEHKTFLELHCCNNRKVQEMYYSEVADFWEKLQSNQKFRNLCGIDKYFIQLNQQKGSMEVVFKNFVPYCLLTNALKQIDKVVALALSIDEVIQICQKKAQQREGFEEIEIKPYMIDEVIRKFEWSLAEIEKHTQIYHQYTTNN